MGGIIYLCMMGIVCIFVLLKRNSQVAELVDANQIEVIIG